MYVYFLLSHVRYYYILVLSVSANQTKGQKGGSDNGRVIGLSVVLSIVGSIAVAAVIAIFLMLRKRLVFDT